ncbi:hypothetical protein LAZ67_6001298, partial [Cordylochernes scorpioides]
MAHDFGKCPAYGKECYKCRQPNHFANCCKNRAIRCIQEIEEEKDNLLIIDSIMVGQVLRKPWKELIYIQGHPVDIKLDTGADVNILPESLIKEWPNMPLLETADCKIYTYTGQQIPVVGKCLLDYDLLIWGNSIEDHNSTLKKVLDLARESRLKLTLNKLQMASGEVKFLGHTISQEGILLDQDKVRAIQNMQIPKNKQELQRILGTVTYLAKFIPDLSSNTSNIRNLLKKDIIWNWNIAADQELNFIKTLLTSPPVLRHFDPNEPLELFADASKDGLGAILMQKEKPLSYASASLTSPQKHYSQIEKELLALYFGCKRFHYFLYGRKFTAYTDHKPLVSLLKKNFDQMSPRLQRLSLYLLNYQFELKFIPGKSMIPADTLSRHFLPQEQMEDKELDLCSQTFVLNVEIKDQRLTRLQEDTLNDKECCLLKQYISTGWPLHKKNLPSNLKPYWEFKEELHEWQNLICRGNKLLIPKTQRSDILKILHASHQGINNTIALAKGFIYRPGMNKEIEELINNCSICQQTSIANLKEPLLPHQAPEYPWQKVGIDIFQIESSKYLLIADYFSKYPEIYQLQDMTTDTIIRRLKRTFSNFGIPETLVSDNGPPFFSKEFHNFTRTWNIVHVTSSPYHAQSNGMVERTVQTLKKLIKRCGEESTDPYLALLNLRNTPHNNLPSPAQILMSRKLRSIIPSKTSQFVPSMINNEAIQKQLVDNQVKMKNYYDTHTRPADPLSINDRVWFRKDKRWIPGQLKNQANEPRSFYVKDQEGNEYRRNRIHIREDKRSETTHTDWEKPLELNQEQADLQDLEETPSQPTSSGQLSSPGSPENVTTTGPPESCTNGSPWNLITTRSGRIIFRLSSFVFRYTVTSLLSLMMVETRSGKMQDPAQERIKAEESAKPQPGATIGRDASSDPVVLNPNIDIPKYDGTEDPRPWIESLEEIGFLYHWADYIISRYAAMNMIGSAKTWLNLHKVSFTSWENFKSRLIEDFASDANKEEMRMRLNRIQQWNEPAIRFAEDILVLCNKVDPQMEEETKINWVIGGLKKEYSFALHLNPPKNTNELLEICKKLDLFEKNYQERAEKSKALYNGPRSPRPHHQEQWKNATSFRRPYQNTSKPQAPAPRYYQNTSKPQAPTPRYYQNKPLPQVSAPRRSYTPNPEPKPVYPSKTYNKNPNANRNRTEDGRPICFKCNKPGHVARYCRVRIGICEALIDTGADLSVVDLSTALNTGLEIINPDKMCSGPDGKELDIVGNIILNIKFDDKTITHQFVIMRTHLRIFILGRDFLKKMNAKIDCQREIIKYDLTENRDVIKYQQKKIKSAKDAIIPELSIKLINAFVEAEDGEYIIEENHKMFQTNGLRLARSLINVVNKETYIWITNPYPRPLKILKNQTLCFGSQPAEVNLMEESEQKEHEEPQFQINENLAYTEKEQLKQVLERYEDLFSSGLGRSNLAKHRIDTEGAKPIKHKPYRVSAKEREIIKEQIDEMLRDGIIRPSSSPWSFPVILVKKRDGKYRFCVDYRKLNDVTVKDVYPIPRIDEVLDTLQGSKYFSAIDLKSGYWQVEVEEKDKEKTAFTTAHGLYEFNVMPFGLCNAPATFERNMENMLGNLRWQICLCYLDDVIIYSSDFSTHLKRIEAVLKCFREANLKLNNKKCQFAFEELEILGHITNQHGIKPAEHNIKAIRDFPRPKKIKEVQSFLGMCSYYRKFIKGFSKIADPLTSLIKKNAPFTWTENQEKAFQTLKVALINPPILGHFDPNAITYIHTDASNIGLGATLVQKFGDKEKVISYLSRTLSKPEQNYSTTEKECLAVVWSMSKLRPYLYGRHFKIVTDHHALCWLKNLKDPTGRLARWALKIQEYNFEIIHKSGKKHLDADGLSRGPLPENEWDEDYERLFLNQIIDEKDDFIENIKENLSGNKRSITQNFKEENGCLYKKNPNPEGRAWLLVVPKKRRKEVMSEYHNHMLNGHLGVARTTYRLKNKYYWPSMLKDVSEFVKTCHLCQSRKGSNHLPSGLLQPIPPANYPFERIGIDFVGPLPSTKRRRKWIIVLTDYYTKYAETKAVSEATVKEVSTFLIEHIILRHGAPRFLISDRGSQFTSNLMKEVMKMCKVKHCFTTSYHPQTNGLTERLNRTLINMISMYVNTDQKNWDEILPFITHAYNTTIQETTGYSPFFLLFGREPMSLLDDENIPTDSNMDDYDEYIENYLDKIARTRQVVINNTEKTQERMKRNYDKKHNEKIYEPGHLVAVWTPVRKIGKCEKLLRKYFGPYRILKKLSNVNYLIEPKDNSGQDPLIVHVSRLKPYFERIDEVTHEDVTTSGEGEVMVETRSGKMQDPAQERIKAEESAKPQPGATIYKHKRRTETVKQEDSVELKEMTVKIEEATQVGNYFVQHLPRNPSMFSGEDGEDPLTWLRGYKRVAKHNHWDETLCLANVYFYLNGTALKWFENNEETIRNWEEFTTQLESVFGKSESLRLLAEKKLKIRAQLKGESTEFYMQDVLRLCKEVDLQMSEEDKISHLMKGIVEELYQALLPRDINNTDQFVSECRRIEALHRRRVTPAKYERLPNVASLDVCNDNTDLSSMIRQIVREEVQRALAAPREEPRIATIEDMVREEIDKTLAPISNPSRGSPQYRTYTPSPIARRETAAPQTPRPRARYPKQGERLDTNEWRTIEGRPICFHCGRPGHVARYCRDRRRQNDERENGYSQGRQEPMFFYGSRPKFPALNDDEPRDNFRRYRSPSPYPGRNGQHSSPIRGSKGNITSALVDSGASYSVVSERFRLKLKKIMFAETDVSLRVANGKIIKPKGRCSLKLDLNGLQENFEFIVLEDCSHDVILGWDFLKLSRAVIDSAEDTLFLEEFLVEDTPKNNSPLYAEREYRIEPASCQLIGVLSRDISDNATVVAESQKGLSLERELMAPSSIISLTSNRGKLWVANWSPYPKIIPQGMHVADGVVIEDSQLCVLAEGNHVGTDIGHSEDSKIAEILNIDDSLDDFQKEKLRNLLRNYRDIFEFRKKEASKTDNVKHRISTGDHLPTKQRPYRVAPAERQIIQEEVNKMEEIGIIQPSASPWASPVVLVRKKDGSWRFCVDYRRLNKITKKDVYPLPRIDDTLDCLQGARFYSSMDLQSGYWQIDVEESDREKTAFITPDGLYEFKVMPFGLCNAPATFERMMDGLLKGLRWTICLCYLDDIVVFSDDFEEHLRRLQLVLGCLRKAGLCLNPGKCRFGAKTITVLGHKKDSVFSWNIEERHAFEALKSALISEPVLGHFDHSSPTEIHTDASNYGIGAVLAQIQKGKERAIAYASRTLNKAERNYSTTERECLAIIWAIGKFRPYVFGRQFTIVTDHHSLCWLTNLKDPCGKLARWALRLQEFDVTVVHKSGRKHQDADCLSRSPLNCSEDIEEDIPCIVALQNFGREQMKDPDLTKIADKIQQETSNKSFIKINDTLHKKNYDPMGREWLLVVPRHLRPEILRNLHDSPTSGHLGFTKTYDRIRKKLYWPGMYRNVRKYVAHCPDCQRRKRQPQLPSGLLQPIPVPIAAFEKVGMDLLGRFPTSMVGNRWIIVCTDYLTKFAITKALPTSESVEVAKFFIKDVILKHGAPREVITDRGRNFTSSMIRDLNKHCRITHRTTTAYHPQTNGLTERLNKTIANMLSMYVDVNQKDWDEILPFVTFAYNTAKQESTGFSPFYLVHGREAETPLDLLFPKFPSEDEDDFIQTLGSRAEEARQLARIHTMRSQGGNKLRYDAHHRNIIYQPGDLVWIYIPVRKVGLSVKLMRRYFGPYRVTRKISDVTYEVETFGDQHGRRKTKDIVHICRMKPYLDPEKREDHLEEDMEDNLSSPQKEEVPAEGRQPPLAQEEVPRPRDLDIPGPITRSRARRLEAQDVLCLCKEVDPQMSEEDKISQLMKGIAEELYQALLPRDVQSTEQFITECRRVEALRCRRVTPTRYERLPNVASLCDQDDGEDLSSMIRQIVREEVQRALDSPREEPKNATIEEIVKEEIGRTLAPISKSRRSPLQKEKPRQFLNTRYEAETIRPPPEPRYPKQGGRRDTNDWRTTEGRPICFYCGRPGHVVRYCRDRKRHNEERRNVYFQRKQDAM